MGFGLKLRLSRSINLEGIDGVMWHLVGVFGSSSVLIISN